MTESQIAEHEEEWRRQEIDDRAFLEEQDMRYYNPYRCETCKWLRYSEVDDEMVCMNRMSPYHTECVWDYDTCEEWERKEK